MKEKQRKLLLQLRSSLVGKMHVQPFTIYDDATVERLLQAQPHSLEELASVKGFPKDGKRIKGFGLAVVCIFSSPNKVDSFELSGDEEDVSVRVKAKRMQAF